MQTQFLCWIIMAPLGAIEARVEIPEQFQGVWEVVLAVEENGDRISRDDVGFRTAGYPVEILIAGNRIVTVKEDGSSVVAKANILEDGQVLTLDLRTGIAHDKENSPTYWNLSLRNDQLIAELAIEKYDEDPRTNKTAIPSYHATKGVR